MRGATLAAIATAAGALAVAPRARAEAPAPPRVPLPAPAPARETAPVAAIPGDGRSPDQLRAEVLERMRALRAWRIVDVLKLDQNASARLFPILSKYDDREMALATERQDITRLLRTEVESARPDDGRLNAAITRLVANRERRRALEDERVKELRKVLTPVQQAKLMLLLPKLEREFDRRVQQAADEQRRMRDDAF